jgi:phenylacetate-CoA ligase
MVFLSSPFERRAAEFIHHKIPRHIQEFFSPVAVLLSPIYLRDSGPLIYYYYCKLRKSQWWPRERIEEYQLNRLKKIIEHSYENVPYYTKLFKREGMKPSDIRCFDDMERIPVLTKDDVRSNLHLMLSRKKTIGDMTAVSKTSGTTGKPIRIYHSKKSASLMEATVELSHDMAGMPSIFKRAMSKARRVCSEGTGRAARGFFFGRNPDYDPMIRQILFRNLASSRIFMEHVKTIRKLKPEFMISRPYFCYLFAKFLMSNGISDIKFKSIICLGDTLLYHQRRLIERQFGCRLFNFYINSEWLSLASECRAHGGVHLYPENSFTEILRKDKACFNKTGKITATTLHEQCMPLIRYEIGDLGKISRRRCGCGRQSLMLKSLEGRTSDIIELPDGNFIFPVAFVELLSRARNIKESQVVQESERELLIRLVKDPNHTDKDTNRLLSSIKPVVGPDIRIQVSFEEKIYEEGKKQKFVVSKVPIDF